MSLNTGIYKITNTANGKIYLGSAINFSIRWNKHKSDLTLNKHHSPHLQVAYNKYGKSAFTYEVVMYCSKEDLLFYEQRFLDAYWDGGKTCYNTCKIAGSTLGISPSKETRAKLSIKLKGIPHTQEHNAKVSVALTGRHLSESHKQHLKKTDKEKQHLSHIKRGINNTNSKLNESAVIEILKTCSDYKSIKIAALKYNVSFTTIYDVVKKRTWKHINLESVA
jgi:group I intron endonuclease